jgi:hypothetical protein
MIKEEEATEAIFSTTKLILPVHNINIQKKVDTNA